MRLLDTSLIRALLAEFVERLGDTGERYDGVVVGGAALALEAIPSRSATQDIDTFGQLSAAARALAGAHRSAMGVDRECAPLRTSLCFATDA